MKAQFVVVVLALGFSACAKKQKAVMLEDTLTEQAVAQDDGTKTAKPAAISEKSFGRAPIYFDYNSAELSPTSRARLDSLAKSVEANPDATVVIEGNTDSRGTTEYNLALGEKRARSARDYLGRLGFDTKRMALVSYGEERPVAFGDSEDAYSRNRRDEFRIVE